MYKAVDVARYVINFAIDNGKPISNLQLQKILYYIQAGFLVEKGTPCFKDEIVNWQHGPVVESVYNEFKRYMSSKIRNKQTTYKEFSFDEDWNIKYIEKQFSYSDFALKDRFLIDKIIMSLINYDAWTLVDKTHEEDPWLLSESNEIITKDNIKKYFIRNKERIYG